MFKVATRQSNRWAATYRMVALTYHLTVHAAGGNKANPLFGLFLNVAQTLVFILALYLTMTLLRVVPSMFRGDFVVFLISGVMAYMTYNKTMKAVYGASGPLSPMMHHPGMNSVVAIAAAALGTLYQQVLIAFVILFGYHVAFKPVEIEDPPFAVFMMIAAWVFGIATGLILLSIRPWAPKLAPILMMIISRVNVFASGKMMIGNALSFYLLKLFDWNPLFHCIDQMRGAIFLNYTPRNSEVGYIFEVSAALIVVGLMMEFFTRRRVSASWNAR